MRFEITGTVMQTLSIDLSPGEVLVSQTHAMAWMSDGIGMDTHTGGGLWAGLKRAMSGGSLFITEYAADRPAHIAFAPRFPGTILPVTLGPGQSIICRKETFLVAEKSISLEIALQQRLGAGFFAGEGFILQRVTGPGTVFLDLSGEVVQRTVAHGHQRHEDPERAGDHGEREAHGPDQRLHAGRPAEIVVAAEHDAGRELAGRRAAFGEEVAEHVGDRHEGQQAEQRQAEAERQHAEGDQHDL